MITPNPTACSHDGELLRRDPATTTVSGRFYFERYYSEAIEEWWWHLCSVLAAHEETHDTKKLPGKGPLISRSETCAFSRVSTIARTSRIESIHAPTHVAHSKDHRSIGKSNSLFQNRLEHIDRSKRGTKNPHPIFVLSLSLPRATLFLEEVHLC